MKDFEITLNKILNGDEEAERVLTLAIDNKQLTKNEAETILNEIEKPQYRNNPAALWLGGIIHRTIEPIDYKNAIEFYEKAIALNHPHAMNDRAYMYLHALGGGEDIAKGLNLYDKAISYKNPDAMVTRGRMLLEGGHKEKAFELFILANELNFSPALCWLGRYYYLEKKYALAIDYFEAAIQQQINEAIYYRAEMYADCKAGPVNLDKAIELYEQYIGLGKHIGKYPCALLYVQRGSQQDIKRAIILLEQAIKEGCAKSMNLRGLIYHLGLDGHRRNYQRAITQYEDAIKEYNSDAMNNRAVMLFQNPLATYEDKKSAIKLYQQAAELNNTSAITNFAILHKKDIRKLLILLTRAINQDSNPVAMYHYSKICCELSSIPMSKQYYKKLVTEFDCSLATAAKMARQSYKTLSNPPFMTAIVNLYFAGNHYFLFKDLLGEAKAKQEYNEVFYHITMAKNFVATKDKKIIPSLPAEVVLSLILNDNLLKSDEKIFYIDSLFLREKLSLGSISDEESLNLLGALYYHSILKVLGKELIDLKRARANFKKIPQDSIFFADACYEIGIHIYGESLKKDPSTIKALELARLYLEKAALTGNLDYKCFLTNALGSICQPTSNILISEDETQCELALKALIKEYKEKFIKERFNAIISYLLEQLPSEPAVNYSFFSSIKITINNLLKDKVHLLTQLRELIEIDKITEKTELSTQTIHQLAEKYLKLLEKCLSPEMPELEEIKICLEEIAENCKNMLNVQLNCFLGRFRF